MELVFQKNNKEITTSQTVAKVFCKNHSKVLRDIRELGCSEEFSRANFGLVKDTWVLAYSLKWRLSKTSV